MGAELHLRAAVAPLALRDSQEQALSGVQLQSHPALGINRVRNDRSCDSRAGCSMHSQR